MRPDLTALLRHAPAARAALEELQQARKYDWPATARPEQLLPPGAYQVCLVLAGRGFGKTRMVSEQTRIWIRTSPIVNVAAPTWADARDVLIEGESGILSVCPQNERPVWFKSQRSLRWPNGGRSLVLSADEPERFRGPQCHKFVADELGVWRYPESWDNAMLGLRLGDNPQALVATTPRTTKLLKQLLASPNTKVIRGTTYDNRAHLARGFFEGIIGQYEGTRRGRQELMGEFLEDNPGALWKHDLIDAARVACVPDLQRIVIGVDPAVTSNEDSDLTGIVAAGRDNQNPPHFYVLDDASLIASPDTWARAVVRVFRQHKADRIIGETNNGGDLVESVIRHVDANAPFTAVHASRGKVVRAEPIAALYEQGRVHHVGSFPELEDEMCDFDPAGTSKSPDRMDALVWALTELGESSMGAFTLIEYLKQLSNGTRNPDTGELIEVPPEPPSICIHCGGTVHKQSKQLAQCSQCYNRWELTN